MPRELVATAPGHRSCATTTSPARTDADPDQDRVGLAEARDRVGRLPQRTRRQPPLQHRLGRHCPRPPEAGGRAFREHSATWRSAPSPEVGAGVTRFALGDRVFGHLPIRETQTVDEADVDLCRKGFRPRRPSVSTRS